MTRLSSGCLSCIYMGKSVASLFGQLITKFRTSKFRPGIAFTICTNQFLSPKNSLEGLKLGSKMRFYKFNSVRKPLPLFQMFLRSWKFSAGTTEKVVLTSIYFLTGFSGNFLWMVNNQKFHARCPYTQSHNRWKVISTQGFSLKNDFLKKKPWRRGCINDKRLGWSLLFGSHPMLLLASPQTLSRQHHNYLLWLSPWFFSYIPHFLKPVKTAQHLFNKCWSSCSTNIEHCIMPRVFNIVKRK